MVKSTLLILPALAAVSVQAYSVVAEPSCDALLICRSIAGNQETAILNENGTVAECLFGQTSIDNRDGNGFCNGPCQGFEVFDCRCASEGEKERGLKSESYVDALLGGLAFAVLFIIGFIQGVSEYRFRNKMGEYLEKRDAAKGDETLIDVLPPQPPRLWCYCIGYILFLVLMITSFVSMANTRNQDYWVGCGTEEEGFFRNDLKEVVSDQDEE